MTAPMHHLILGPSQHGVVRCAKEMASATASPVITDLRELSPEVPIHLHFTDRLYGRTAGEAANAVEALSRRHRAPITVTLHDVPQASDGAAFSARAHCYRQVVEIAAAVVVSSAHERSLLADLLDTRRDIRVIPLPIHRNAPVDHARAITRRVVAVLGFVYPGKGHVETLGAMSSLDRDIGFLSIGSASPGHEDLIDDLRCTARRVDRAFETTGFVPDSELDALLQSVAVPVAYHRHISASGSINSWIAAGRRPLVPRGRYVDEIETASPGALWIHDDSPDALADAMAAALKEPESTWQANRFVPYPSTAQAAALYRALFDEQLAPTALRLPDGRCLVPRNRWDLAPSVARTPRVSVVIPYFRQQRQLNLVLTALKLQTYPASHIQVVVADDGSEDAPEVEMFRSAFDITVVRQADHGFRAAAARNLGASAADGSVLCFVDADTVPEPGYIAASVALPTVVPDALVVGRRRHADLTAWTGADIEDWFGGRRAGPRELTEPQWLRDGYAESRDLLDADRRSYRYIISAVMTCSRMLFRELDGFDDTIVGYGGEDWDLAHRAFDCGAVFAHRPGAIAWHDGQEWAERTDGDRRQKNDEAMMLASRITDPAARTHGLIHAIPETVVVVHSAGHSAASLLRTVGSVLAQPDCSVWLSGSNVDDLRRRWGDVDPRIHMGSPADTGRSHAVLEVHGRVLFGDGSIRLMLATGADRITVDVNGAGTVELRSTRSVARASRWAAAAGRPPTDLADSLFGHVRRTGVEFGISIGEIEPTLSW